MPRRLSQRPKKDAARAAAKTVRRRSDAVRYQALVARAIEQIQYFERTGRMMTDGSTVFGVVVQPEEGEPSYATPPAEQADSFGQRRSNWISEIDVDVKRTYVIDRGYDLWKNVTGNSSGSDAAPVSVSASVSGEGSGAGAGSRGSRGSISLEASSGVFERGESGEDGEAGVLRQSDSNASDESDLTRESSFADGEG